MSKGKLFRTMSILLVLVSALAFVVPASATGESVAIMSFDQSICTPGAYPAGVVEHVNGTEGVYIGFSLWNNSKGTVDGWLAGLLASGNYTFDVPVPASTEEGDAMTLMIEILDAGYNTLAVDTRDYTCGTGAGIGPDMIELTGAVVGTFLQNTAIMQTPGVVRQPEIVMEAGKTLWVLGVDETGMYYKVALSGQFFWVPVGSMGPNYDEVWNGTPLPTKTVY